MPVRSIPKNYRNVTGILASPKAGGAAQYESTLERDFFTLLDFSTDIKSFDPQPVKIEWLDEDRRKRVYTPDALVTFVEMDGRPPWLYEVKYRSELKEKWAELHPKFKAAVHFAKQHGWRFKIVTEREIRTPYLVNVQFLTHHRRTIPSAAFSQKIFDYLDGAETATPRALIDSLAMQKSEQAQVTNVLWHLIATFQIATELYQPLTMKSRIWRSL